MSRPSSSSRRRGGVAQPIVRGLSQPADGVQGSLPLKEYFALQNYLACLLCASFVFLPRSSIWGNFSQKSSADRPEHPFLTPITSRPLVTMAWDLAGLAIIIMWWGQHLSSWAAGKRTGTRDERRRNLAKRLRDAFLATVSSALVFATMICLLGAPLDSLLLHTFLLALHLSLLIVWPVVHSLGLPSIHDAGLYDRIRMTKLMCRLSAESPFERALVYPMVGTLCGAWVGVLPICLDWDRPWQSYPLTPTIASTVGFIAGGYISWIQSALETTA